MKQFLERIRNKGGAPAKYLVPSGLVVGLVAAFVYLFFIVPPADFPRGSTVNIPEGVTLAEAATILHRHEIIQSELMFSTLVTLRASEASVVAGTYYLHGDINVIEASRVFSRGEFGVEPMVVLIHEGMNSRDIAERLDALLPGFSRNAFLRAARTKEGRLFPDTYEILPTTSEADIVEKFTDTYEHRIATLEEGVQNSPYTEDEILTMASLVEREARGMEDKRLVAGVLWKRLKQDMRLQVDAVFPYLVGKGSFELTQDDLRIDSPYNTYRYTGLPPAPIANPGLESLRATLNYEETDYLYYLTGRDGEMYYARDFEEHVENRRKYL